MNSKNKAQGALDYLLLIGGAVLIAAIVVVSITYLLSSEKSETSKTKYQSSYACLTAQTEPLLVGYWAFEGDVKDCTKYENHGTIGGNPVFVDGVHGKALHFDGTGDNVNVGNDNSLNFASNQPFTVEAWIKTDAIGANYTIIQKGPNDATEELTVLNLASNKWYFDWGAGGAYRQGSVVAADTWYHFVGRYNGNNTGNIFINGVEIVYSGQSNNIHNKNTFDLVFGQGRGLNNFHGTLDEVKIYNRALTDAEILAHATQ